MLWVASAYRGEERQGVLFEREVEKNLKAGMEEAEARQDALRTVALPGRSEHQTGLAVDFNDVSQNFQRTEAYQWLQRHGAEYGFVQRYQKEKESVTGVSEEPWHYRYVGRAHAGRMEKGKLCLEEYVLSLEIRKKQAGVLQKPSVLRYNNAYCKALQCENAAV